MKGMGKGIQLWEYAILAPPTTKMADESVLFLDPKVRGFCKMHYSPIETGQVLRGSHTPLVYGTIYNFFRSFIMG